MERGLLLAQRVKTIAQKLVRLAVEAGSRTARIDQAAMVVVAEQQGSDAMAAGRKRSEAAHDEFLLQDAL
jgi:hypothetical protein